MKLRHSSLSIVALLLWAQTASAEIVLGAANARAEAGSASTLDFTVRRTGETGVPVSFDYRSRDGSALAGRDYKTVAGQATIPADQTEVVIPVPLVSGGASGSTLKFELLIGSPAVAGVDPSTAQYAGAGAFQIPRYADGSAVADFNGDGLLDAAFSGSGGVTVLANATRPGELSGRFTQAAHVDTGPGRVRVVDLNRDGKPDLIVAESGTNQIDVLMNTTPKGSNTGFTFTVTPFTTVDYGWASDVAFADFDGDGIVDIVASNPGLISIPQSGRALVMRNTTPRGALVPTLAVVAQLPVTPLSNALPHSVAAADFNGDGKPDIAIDSFGTSVMLNTTRAGATVPTFASPVRLKGLTNANEMAIADFDRDGRPDIATANADSAFGSTWSVLRNTTAPGSAKPSFRRTEFIGTGAFGIRTADMDGDGFQDLVLANLTSNGSFNGNYEVHRFLGVNSDGSMSFTTTATLESGDDPHTISVGDFNNDGWLDLVGVDWGGTSAAFNFQRPGLVQPRITKASATGTIVR